MNNTYGIVRPSLVNVNDIEIWYNYQPTRNSINSNLSNFQKIKDISSIIKNSESEEPIIKGSIDKRLPGMYDLSLPASIFSNKGFYTIYIKPKEFTCTIKDVGALSAYPDINGIVLDMNEIKEDRALFSNDNLVGYRVEYFEYQNNGLMRQDYYRLITSNNLCESMTQNLPSSYTNANGYRYNESGSLVFLTLTPSTSLSFKNNQRPYIGAPNQVITITNTKFDPVCIEVEMCENDIDTLTTAITGNQIRSLDNGLVTTYTDDGEIFMQQEFATIKDNYTSNDVYEVRKKKNDIDFNINYEELINE